MRINRLIYNQMVKHAKKDYPNEACGLLASDAGNIVKIFYPMKNMDHASISYFMDPKEQLQIFKEMRQKSLDLCGIFHSHVASEAYPSQKDVRLAFYPEASYLILSLTDQKNPVLRSYKIVEEKVTEEPVTLID